MDKVFCGECKYYAMKTWPVCDHGNDYCVAPENMMDSYRRKNELQKVSPEERNRENNCPWYDKRQEIVIVPTSKKLSFSWWRK